LAQARTAWRTVSATTAGWESITTCEAGGRDMDLWGSRCIEPRVQMRVTVGEDRSGPQRCEHVRDFGRSLRLAEQVALALVAIDRC